MLHGVAGKRCAFGFQVQIAMVKQVAFARETQTGVGHNLKAYR